MNTDLMFSSSSGEYGTPQWLFDDLDREFHFDLDPAATKKNAKCKLYYTSPIYHVVDQGRDLPVLLVKPTKRKNVDGLTLPWAPHNVFLNPPYGNHERACLKKCKKKRCSPRGYHVGVDLPGVGDWVAKGVVEMRGGATVVQLLPMRTDTHWFVESVMRWADEVRIIPGRLKFEMEGVPWSAPFPSSVVVFRPVPLISGGRGYPFLSVYGERSLQSMNLEELLKEACEEYTRERDP